MNRSLLVPAMCCLLAFASLYAGLNKALGERHSADTFAHPSSASQASGASSFPVNEAERVLGSLCDEYLRRLRAWEASPHRLLSRAAPRTASPMSVELAVSPKSSGQGDTFLLATILLHRQEQTETIPCVVDPTTKWLRLFHEGTWLTDDEWLRTAPSMPMEINRKAE